MPFKIQHKGTRQPICIPVGDGRYWMSFKTREEALQYMKTEGLGESHFEIVEFPGVDDFKPTFKNTLNSAASVYTDAAEPMTPSKPLTKD